MKHFKHLFFAALSVLTLASCSQEDQPAADGPGAVPLGKDTYASFSFRIEGNQPRSRTAMEGAAGKDDNTVSDGRLLIFDNVTGLLLNNVAFTVTGAATDLTVQTTSGPRRIYIVAGATSDKTQITGRLAGLAENTALLSDFYALMSDQKYTGAAAGDTDMGEGFKELPVSGKFVMSNVADRNAVKTLLPGISKEQASGGTAEDADVNRFNFNVLRAVAKADLKVALKGTEKATADGIFKLKDDVWYGVRNINRSTLYVQQYINDNVDAGIDNAGIDRDIRPFAAFYNAFDGTSENDMKLQATFTPYYFGGYAINGTDAAHTTLSVTGGTPVVGPTVFISENSNNRQVRGNTSYYGITTQVSSIAPDDIAGTITLTDIGLIRNTAATTGYDNTTGDKSFWHMREVPADVRAKMDNGIKERWVFTDVDAAFEAMRIFVKVSASITLTTAGFTPTDDFTATDLKEAYQRATGTISTPGTELNATDAAIVDRYLGYYANGFSYYRLNLYETVAGAKRHLVRRNNHYGATVTSFATIGDPTEGDLDKDPDKPVDADLTNVTAVITVMPWYTVDTEDDL
ncbi:Mfa1 family fimbria major subunit [Coprobacter tertius]|uniref:Mfa1 family fimbria major subunit n=1 Tax=Coprobacter tertius TaxID=2944915 RepID=A0ABT1MHB8_9BACT|nr:Mfa1 family fimbria major subunit [Coprobacter tertius]MCP9611776.1 Mfa1 family fimbria major subunit [Coprobacter tertius]